MTTETADAVNTETRQAKMETYAKATRRLALLQRMKANAQPLPAWAMTQAHNELQAANQALRMPAVESLLGVDFEEEIIEPASDPAEDLMNLRGPK